MSRRNSQRSLMIGECNLRVESLLAGILQRHKGAATAVPMEDLARTVGLSTRELQIQIKHLIEHHGQLIGSATGAPHGYYLVTDAKELSRAKRQLWNRAMSNLVRIARLDRISVEEVFGQMPMRFSEFMKGESHVQG